MEAGAEVEKAIVKRIVESREAGAIEVEKLLFEKYPPRVVKGKPAEQMRSDGLPKIKQLIDRIDDGYEIEGDVGDVDVDGEAEEIDQEKDQLIAAIKYTKELSHEIRSIEHPDEPVMRLLEDQQEGDNEIDDIEDEDNPDV